MRPKKRVFVLTLSALMIFGVLFVGIAMTQGNPFIDFSEKNPKNTLKPEIKSKIGTEIPFLSKGGTLDYEKKVIIEVPLGTTNSDFGLLEEEELPGSFIAPGAIAINRQGEIYINDPLNKAINKYSNKGVLTEKIAFGDWPQDIGIDNTGNLYVLGVNSEKVFVKRDGKDELTPLDLKFNRPLQLEVMPSGNFMVLDYTGLPDDNLRVQKFTATGTLITKKEQHNNSLSLYEFEDQIGVPIKLEKLGGGISSEQQYLLSHGQHQIVYQPLLPEGYIYNLLQVLGTDNSQNLYFLRIVRPDNLNVPTQENFKKAETWVDVINLANGTIGSLSLEKDTALSGVFNSKHRFRINSMGNIYQLIETPETLKVIQYKLH